MKGSILFDLYGTLIDIHTEENTNKFWKTLSRRLRKYKYYDYKKLKNSYLMLCDKYSKEFEEIEILNVFIDLFEVDKNEAMKIAHIFRRLSTKYIRLYKGSLKFLNKLKLDGYKLYVLSNAQSSFTIRELKKLNIYHLFDGIAISSDYTYKKPNIKFYQNAMMNFNLDYANTIMVGNDYICDILGSKNANLKNIFIYSNLTPGYKEYSDIDRVDYKIVYKIIKSLIV